MVIIMMINTKKTLAEILDQTTTNENILLELFERWGKCDDQLDSFWLNERGKKDARDCYGESTVLEIKTYKNAVRVFLKGGETF